MRSALAKESRSRREPLPPGAHLAITVALALTVAGGSAIAFVASRAAGVPPAAFEAGSGVFDVDLFTDEDGGALLASTNATHATSLVSNAPSWRLLPAPRQVVLPLPGGDHGPHSISGALAPHVRGMGVGERKSVSLGVIAEWGGTVGVPKFHGPFPLVQEARADAFDGRGPRPVPGDVLTLDHVVEGRVRVLQVNATTLRYAVEVGDGEVLRIPRTGLSAIVSVQAEAKTFTLRLSSPAGHAFGVAGSCANPLFSLEPGAYRSAGENDSALWFERSPLPFPDLVGVPLRADLHLITFNARDDVPLLARSLAVLARTRAGPEH